MGMKQNLNSSRKLGTFLSPEINQEKGWSSERVQNPLSNNIRRMSGLSPFYSGRATPSKWDDAERWISSPVFGYGVAKYSSQSQGLQPHRRPKSKSGPIVPPGVSYGSNFVANSPFSTGVLMPRGMGTHFNGGLIGEHGIVGRSVSGIGNGWSNLASDCSSPCSQVFADEIPDNVNGDGNAISRVISRRDMATQMSPEGSKSSSPLSNCLGDNPSKMEIREVQVDKRAVISETSRNYSLLTKKRTEETREFDLSDPVSGISTLDVEASSKYSKFHREEAKITAWENLQKAKAEAAIRKLEMKLEKKRASSMDKILKKLRVAQNKAQEMRSSVSSRHEPQIPWKALRFSVFHRHKRFSSWSCCFSSHASSS